MAISNKNISITLSVEQAEKVKETLRQLGENGDKALGKIEAAKRANTAGFKALKDVTDAAKDSVNGYASQLGVAGQAMSRFGTVGLATAAALGGLTLGIRSVFHATLEAQDSVNRFEAALSSMGNNTGYTKAQLEDMAGSMSRALKIDDEDLLKTMASVATFGEATGKHFKEIIELSADLSASWGGDLASSGQAISDMMDKLGSGSAAVLAKAFSFLTKEQQNLITSLAEGGKAADAQRVFLDALQKQIGTAAETRADSLVGAVAGLSNEWSNLKENIGDLVPFRNAMAALNNLLARANDNLNFKPLSDNSEIESLREKQQRLSTFLEDHKGKSISETRQYKDAFDEYNANNLKLIRLNREQAERDAAAAAEKQRQDAANAAAEEKRFQDHLARAAAEGKLSEKQRAINAAVAQEEAQAQSEGIVLDDAKRAAIRKVAEANYAYVESQKESVATSKKSNEETAKTLEKLRAEVAQKKLLAGAYGQGAEAVKAANVEIEVQNALMSLGTEATAAQREETEKLIRAREGYNKTIDDTTKAQEAAKKALEDQQKEMEAPMKHAAESMQDAFSGAFEGILDGGVKSFKDLGKTVKGIFIKLAAETAALQFFKGGNVFASVVPGVVGGSGFAGSSSGVAASGGAGVSSGGGLSMLSPLGSLLNGGLYSQTLGSIGTGIGNMLGGYGYNFVGPTQAGALGAGALGNLGYGMLGGFGANLLGLGGGIGGTIGNIAGSLAGGAIGTQMGTILGMAGGPLGAIIGGFAGTALGGLFGNSKPTNAAAFGNVDFAKGTATYSHMNKGNSAENMGVLKQAFDAVLAFQQQFSTLGVGSIAGRISGIDAGVRDRQSAYVNGVKVTAAAGQFGQLAINALKEALRQAPITNADVRTAIGKTDFKDTGKAFTDLQFAAGFRDAVNAYKNGITGETEVRKQAVAAGQALAKELTDFVDNTTRLGLDVKAASSGVFSALNRIFTGEQAKSLSATEQAVLAMKTQLEQLTPALRMTGLSAAQSADWIAKATANNMKILRDNFGKGIEQEILAIKDPTELAVQQLNEQFDQMRKDASVLGYDLTKIEELYGLKRKQIVDQTNSAIINSTLGLQEWLLQQKLSDGSSLSTQSKFAEAQSQFSAFVSLARAGDATAISGLTGQADSLLGLGRQMYASGSQYAVLEQMVRSTIEGLVKGGLPNSSGGTALIDAVKGVSQTQALGTMELAKRLDEMTAALAEMQAQLRRANAA